MTGRNPHSSNDLVEQISNLAGERTAGGDTLDDRVGGLLESIRRHLGMEVAFVSEFVGDRRVFRYVDAADGTPAVRAGDGDPLAESYCQRVVDGRLPQLIRDARELPAARELPVTQQLPVGAHISVPIRLSDGAVYGTFCTFQRKADPALNELDLAIVRVFADVVAAFIEQDRDSVAHDEETAARIRQRLAAGEPIGVCQPIVELATGRPIGFFQPARGMPQAPACDRGVNPIDDAGPYGLDIRCRAG